MFSTFLIINIYQAINHFSFVSVEKGTLILLFVARNEMASALINVVKGVEAKNLDLDDVTSDLVERAMYTEDGIVPDLLIRTSGEIRLSDFMLWQSSWSCIYFTPVLWPEFTIWELLKAVFEYQRSLGTLKKTKPKEEIVSSQSEKAQKFLDNLYSERFNQLKAITCES